MIAPLPDEKAKEYCLKLIDLFDQNGVEQVVFNGCDPSNFFKSSEYSQKSNTRNSGQMFGVLICLDDDGNEVVLKAFSGQFRGVWNICGWVPPLLDEQEFIKLTKDSDEQIHQISKKIDNCVNLIEKQKLKQQRHQISKKSMEEIFALYNVPVIDRFITVKTYEIQNPKNLKYYPKYEVKPIIKEKSLFDFFSQPTEKTSSKKKMPPTGAGECCAPKLLSYALKNNLRPISMAEFFYGPSTKSKSKIHKNFYPPCDDKCLPIIPAMLGLDIIYQDNDIVVVNKPSGLLSVPGRGENKQDCVVNRVKYFFSNSIEQPSVHRLDMDTSGLLVLALNTETHKKLSIEFMENRVQKKYLARLEEPIKCGKGVTVTKIDDFENVVAGEIKLPFRLDVENRPYQIYDEVYGKMGHTIFRILENGPKPLIEFMPITGRTHQLRLHASSIHGLASPICGDNLYGNKNSSSNIKLQLFAFYLEFNINDKKMSFVIDVN